MEGMLGGIVGLVGAGLQASNQAAQIEEEYAALNWQKQRAAQQDRFAQAGRSDAYGNLTSYDPALNKWGVKLAPTQQQISDASQREQLLQLQQDAPAARRIKQAIQARAAEAAPLYHQALEGYQYDQPKSEEAIRSELTGLMANNDMLKSKADQALIMRSAIRLGAGARAPDIINTVDQQLGNSQTTNDRMLQARQQAMQEYGARLQQHEAKWGTPMKMYADLMAQGGDIAGVPKSAMEQSTNASIQQQMAGANTAFNQGTTGVSSAMQALAQAMGKSPDLSAAASAFSKMKFGSGTTKDSDTYDPSINNMGWSSFNKSTENNAGYTDESDAF